MPIKKVVGTTTFTFLINTALKEKFYSHLEEKEGVDFTSFMLHRCLELVNSHELGYREAPAAETYQIIDSFRETDTPPKGSLCSFRVTEVFKHRVEEALDYYGLKKSKYLLTLVVDHLLRVERKPIDDSSVLDLLCME